MNVRAIRFLAAALLAPALLAASWPAVAVEFVITNCATMSVTVSTFNSDDTILAIPASHEILTPNATRPVRCQTSACILRYSMAGGSSGTYVTPYSGNLCFRGWYDWKGAGQAEFTYGNCSASCSNPY